MTMSQRHPAADQHPPVLWPILAVFPSTTPIQLAMMMLVAKIPFYLSQGVALPLEETLAESHSLPHHKPNPLISPNAAIPQEKLHLDPATQCLARSAKL